jgi:hypothetical protein
MVSTTEFLLIPVEAQIFAFFQIRFSNLFFCEFPRDAVLRDGTVIQRDPLSASWVPSGRGLHAAREAALCVCWGGALIGNGNALLRSLTFAAAVRSTTNFGLPAQFRVDLIGLKMKLYAPRMSFAVLGIWKEIAMKTASLFVAGLAVAILSIAPANADPDKCSNTTYPANSAVQCWKPTAAHYAECVKIIMGKGWRDYDAWWTCTNQKFKS